MKDDEPVVLDESEDAHEMAHDLCDIVEAVISAHIEENGGRMQVLTVLLGMEMVSSVWRKMAAKAGVDAETIKMVIAKAYHCSDPHFEERASEMEVVSSDDDDESEEVVSIEDDDFNGYLN